jgi:putative hydrolase of the HAD superfamily
MGIETIFTDLGGVILTNGWDRETRKQAVEHFHLDLDDFEERHREVVDDLESGLLTLESYMKQVVFYVKRPFTSHDFQEYMFSCSKPYPAMINMLKEAKKSLGCKVAALSNEGKELGRYRIDKFGLKEFIDYFVVSSFVGVAKPDERIYNLAINISQSSPGKIIYIDDRPKLIEAGKRMGLRTILHQNPSETLAALEELSGTKIAASCR